MVFPGQGRKHGIGTYTFKGLTKTVHSDDQVSITTTTPGVCIKESNWVDNELFLTPQARESLKEDQIELFGRQLQGKIYKPTVVMPLPQPGTFDPSFSLTVNHEWVPHLSVLDQYKLDFLLRAQKLFSSPGLFPRKVFVLLFACARKDEEATADRPTR